MYLPIVETVEGNFKDGADDDGYCGGDDEGVGGGEGGLLLLLGPDGAGQQLVSSLDVVICIETKLSKYEQLGINSYSFAFTDL